MSTYFNFFRNKLVYSDTNKQVVLAFTGLHVTNVQWPYCNMCQCTFDTCCANRTPESVVGHETDKTVVELIDEQFCKTPGYEEIITYDGGDPYSGDPTYITLCTKRRPLDGKSILTCLGPLFECPNQKNIWRLQNIFSEYV